MIGVMNDKLHIPKRLGRLNTAGIDLIIGYRLRRAKNAVYDDFSHHLGDLGISPVHFSVLCLIADNPGYPQGQLAEALNITRANFATLIKALDKRGLTFRQEAATYDKRVSRLYLTDHGRDFVKLARQRQSKIEKQYIRRLGGQDERDRLLSLLGKLIADDEVLG